MSSRQRPHDSRLPRRFTLKFPARDRLTGLEHLAECPFGGISKVWHDLTHAAAEMRLQRHPVHRRQALVQTDIAQVPIEQGEPRVRRPIERLQLRRDSPSAWSRPASSCAPIAGQLLSFTDKRSGASASSAGRVGGRLASGRLPAARPTVLLRLRDTGVLTRRAHGSVGSSLSANDDCSRDSLNRRAVRLLWLCRTFALSPQRLCLLSRASALWARGLWSQRLWSRWQISAPWSQRLWSLWRLSALWSKLWSSWSTSVSRRKRRCRPRSPPAPRSGGRS